LSDEARFDEFVRLTQQPLWQAIVPLAGPEAASDAVAEALEYAWRHWDRVGSMDNPIGYLYTKARRDVIRTRPAPAFPAPDAALPADFEPRLLPALEELSEMQRQVVYLVDGFGWGLTHVARVLDVSISTVRNHRQRGLERLRELLKVGTDA
jgi:DNA-directed RNA polymerase specialized sigma24 family protein